MKSRFRRDTDREDRARRLCVACAFVVFAAGLTGPARSQLPYVQVYFDDDTWQTTAWCPGQSTWDTLTVYVHNLNTLIIAAEFSVELPPELAYVGSFSSATLAIGDPVVGMAPDFLPAVSYAWSRPQEAFEPFLLTSLVVVWVCDSCGFGSSVVVRPNQQTGSLTFVSWPGIQAITGAIGMYSTICPTPAVETTSWGAVKALYGQDVQ